MRIIERTNPVNKSVLYVVQEENNNDLAYNRVSAFVSTRTFKFLDVRSFATLQEAKDFMHQYQNNLQPGERVVG